MLSTELVRRLLDYDPETGEFRWKVRSCVRKVGDKAGNLNKVHGYLIIGIEGQWYRAHRLAWLHYHGTAAPLEIDHINGNRADNRIGNLRAASHAGNIQNRGAQKNNTSGFKGVSFVKDGGKWEAEITSHGRRYKLGRYATREAAHEAYSRAAIRLHGEYARPK